MIRQLYSLLNLTTKDGKRVFDWYDIVMIVVVMVSMIPLTTREHYWYFDVIEIGATIIFIIDYLLRWLIAPYGKEGTQRTMAYLKYPFTFAAILDLVTILPGIAYINPAVRTLRLWRLLRILRVVKIFRYYEPLQVLLEVFRKKSSMLLTVACFAIFYILATALFMFNVEDATTADGSPFFETYWDAVYWATCTLTTVGYGDIYPITNWGRIISMISALVGIAIIALPSSIITAGYMEEMHNKNKNENKD